MEGMKGGGGGFAVWEGGAGGNGGGGGVGGEDGDEGGDGEGDGQGRTGGDSCRGGVVGLTFMAEVGWHFASLSS